jgi:hypothetical protein
MMICLHKLFYTTRIYQAHIRPPYSFNIPFVRLVLIIVSLVAILKNV